ncbi:MAG: pyridoxal-phosphate dependent enzyme [Candidatus Aenigmarchaeota archaeon]|nr:pyridoxal-phosphate dependent enzyme [Candidatus Aenigmarchaeota archaeon]
MMPEKIAKIAQIREKLIQYPKVEISTFRTPIEYLGNVSRELGIKVRVKREDLSGPAYGGHYSRALEYVFGEAMKNGHDGIVHGGPSHSNQNRLIAAICAKYGLKCHLVLRRKLPVDRHDVGNLFLDQLMGADIKWVTAEMGPELDREKETRYQELVREDRENPYLFRRERVAFLSCLGMLDMFLDTYQQLDEIDFMPSSIYLTGCGPTHSGILLGTRLVDPTIEVVGVRPLHWNAQEIVSGEVNTAARNLGEDIFVSHDEVVNPPEYVGEDYGVPTQKGNEAIRYFAEREALIFDPVYTGKMAACFLDHAYDGRIPKGSRTLIIHSGGTPLTLLYSDTIYQSLGMRLDPPDIL